MLSFESLFHHRDTESQSFFYNSCSLCLRASVVKTLRRFFRFCKNRFKQIIALFVRVAILIACGDGLLAL